MMHKTKRDLPLYYLACLIWALVWANVGCGESSSRGTIPKMDPRMDELAKLLGNTSADPVERRSSLNELVEMYFIDGLSAQSLSVTLSRFAQQVRPGDFEYVRAFAGAWPFDNGLKLDGNTMVGFRVTWPDSDPPSAVLLLLSGHQKDGSLDVLFSGKWPPNDRTVLLAAAMIGP